MTLKKIEIKDGHYIGRLITEDADPSVSLYLGRTKLCDATLKPDRKKHSFLLTCDIPSSALDEGAAVLALIDTNSKEVLDTIAISLGEVEDTRLYLRVSHLEAELDLLKTLLRDHLRQK